MATIQRGIGGVSEFVRLKPSKTPREQKAKSNPEEPKCWVEGSLLHTDFCDIHRSTQSDLKKLIRKYTSGINYVLFLEYESHNEVTRRFINTAKRFIFRQCRHQPNKREYIKDRWYPIPQKRDMEEIKMVAEEFLEYYRKCLHHARIVYCEREKQLKYQRQQHNKDYLTEKMVCSCGKHIARRNYQVHLRTKVHNSS